MARILFAVLFLTGQTFSVNICNDKYVMFSRVFDYHFVDQPLTWTEAQTYCRQRYVDLATIQNSEEIAQLLNTLSSFGHASEVWVGLFYEINWAWSDGFSGSGADYRSWKTSYNEPNFASASQFCVCSDSNGKWWDDFCGNHYPFLCENGFTQSEAEMVVFKTLRNVC
uniref:C-type lectin domain-containing protein n=1 Tax=Fundulus heteroclitus TaxID=8078 RepID=A0A3Q2QYQ5_FUNHE